ncbi:hypothetical protein RRG08_024824 [Elysia crispata]|uniref:Uncharacterized protein n=1 Tax=Elysia crispata TaxID=231223 RepID=A0AAE0YKU3_9GAST|nr:hypothetical protein RRG08_024824 [Elysia crispata]
MIVYTNLTLTRPWRKTYLKCHAGGGGVTMVSSFWTNQGRVNIGSDSGDAPSIISKALVDFRDKKNLCRVFIATSGFTSVLVNGDVKCEGHPEFIVNPDKSALSLLFKVVTFVRLPNGDCPLWPCYLTKRNISSGHSSDILDMPALIQTFSIRGIKQNAWILGCLSLRVGLTSVSRTVRDSESLNAVRQVNSVPQLIWASGIKSTISTQVTAAEVMSVSPQSIQDCP